MISIERFPELLVTTTGDPLENLFLAMVALIGLAGYFSLLAFAASGFIYWLRPKGMMGDAIKKMGWGHAYKKYWGNWASFKFIRMVAPKILTPLIIYKAAMLQGDYFLAASLTGMAAGVFVLDAVQGEPEK